MMIKNKSILFSIIYCCLAFNLILADDSEEQLEPVSNRPMIPPGASNSVYFRAQQEQFKNPPYRNCGKDGVYKDGRCEVFPQENSNSQDSGNTEQEQNNYQNP